MAKLKTALTVFGFFLEDLENMQIHLFFYHPLSIPMKLVEKKTESSLRRRSLIYDKQEKQLKMSNVITAQTVFFKKIY